MEPIATDEQLTAALVIWIGRVPSLPPQRYSNLVEAYGSTRADELLPALLTLFDAFMASEAKHTAPDVDAMVEMASAEFRSKFPGIGPEAVELLENGYAYGNR